MIIAHVLEPGIGIVKLDELEVVAVRARRWFVHDFRNHQASLAAGRTEGLVRIDDGAHHRAADFGDVAKLGGSGLTGVVAAEGEANVNLAGH